MNEIDTDDWIEEVLEGVLAAGGERNNPCPEAMVEKCVFDFVQKFGISLSLGYVYFLRKTNGIIFEDAVFCYVGDEKLSPTAAENELFALNTHYRNLKLPHRYAFLGFDDDGLFVHNAMDAWYAVLDAEDYRILKKFDTFEELFRDAVEGPV